MYSHNTNKTTNEPTASRQIIGEHLGHLKDLKISKYDREPKVRVPIKNYRFIFLSLIVLFGLRE